MNEPCTILDLSKLYELATTMYGESDSLYMKIRNDLVDRNPLGHKWFLYNNHAILFEPIGADRCQIHTFGTTRDTDMKDFFISSGFWMKENTPMVVFLAFIDKKRLDLRFFLKSIGAKKLCELPATRELLYAVTEEDVIWR